MARRDQKKCLSWRGRGLRSYHEAYELPTSRWLVSQPFPISRIPVPAIVRFERYRARASHQRRRALHRTFVKFELRIVLRSLLPSFAPTNHPRTSTYTCAYYTHTQSTNILVRSITLTSYYHYLTILFGWSGCYTPVLSLIWYIPEFPPPSHITLHRAAGDTGQGRLHGHVM